MDPGDALSAASMLKWDPRVNPWHDRARELPEMFSGYGVRCLTVARIGELGFTATTLAGMRDEEIEDMMSTLAHLFRWDLLVGERYGIKAAVRAERRRLESLFLFYHHQIQDDGRTRRRILSPDHHHHPNALDALSQQGISEEAAWSGGETVGRKGKQAKLRSAKKPSKKKAAGDEDNDEEEEEEEEEAAESERSGGGERQREHPFIVTEPGEVARAKKNGLDYLFHLYDQCRHFLLQVQSLAKEQGHKCPTKVTNQVFRYAKKMGASYINKPKMRHYVHCYALHCLDEEVSNALRMGFKERGENVGAWRQACYKPLVSISARHGWDIDAVFNAHPRLAIWYVPTKLRQLCHLARSDAAAGSALSSVADDQHTLQSPMF